MLGVIARRVLYTYVRTYVYVQGDNLSDKKEKKNAQQQTSRTTTKSEGVD